MDPKLIIALVLLVLILLLILLLFLKNLLEQQGPEQGSGGYGDSEDRSNDESFLRMERREKEREQKEKLSLLPKIIKEADPLLLQQLANMAGLSYEEIKDRSHEALLVQKLAERLDLDDIRSLHIATTTSDVKSTSATTTVTEKTPIPTNSIQPEKLTGMEELGSLTTESSVLDDEQFYNALATGELQVLQSYHQVTKKGLKAMLLDVSGSMDGNLSSGVNKCVLARGVTFKLISDSDSANTDFLLRFFDGGVHELMKATDENGRLRLMATVKNEGFSGGGTDILGAIKKMVADIQKLPDIDNADITIITDGQDSNCNDVNQLRSILGPKIKLHVIAIGEENSILKSVATTYTFIS